MTNRSHPRTVLVVDDEPHVVAYLEMVLQDHGYATLSAGNGREGLTKAKAHSPDLICLDITMPEESGIRFYRNLKDDPALFSGLIWTGEQSVELGLVDALGSASQVAREVIGVKKIVDFTPRRSLLDSISRRIGTAIGEALASQAGLGELQLR